MRTAFALCAAIMLAGCASTYESYDTNAAGDANPMCASRADRPGEPVSRDCVRRSGGSIITRRDSQPVDFRRNKDD